MEYPHIFGAMEKNGLDNLTQVKIKNKMVIINTLIKMYQKGFIEGAIGGGKINVNFCSNGNIKFVTHTTHAKWYRDKVIVKEFLTFIAKCDPLFAEYSLSIFGNDCFARDVSENPNSANTSKPE